MPTTHDEIQRRFNDYALNLDELLKLSSFTSFCYVNKFSYGKMQEVYDWGQVFTDILLRMAAMSDNCTVDNPRCLNAKRYEELVKLAGNVFSTTQSKALIRHDNKGRNDDPAYLMSLLAEHQLPMKPDLRWATIRAASLFYTNTGSILNAYDEKKKDLEEYLKVFMNLLNIGDVIKEENLEQVAGRITELFVLVKRIFADYANENYINRFMHIWHEDLRIGNRMPVLKHLSKFVKYITIALTSLQKEVPELFSLLIIPINDFKTNYKNKYDYFCDSEKPKDYQPSVYDYNYESPLLMRPIVVTTSGQYIIPDFNAYFYCLRNLVTRISDHYIGNGNKALRKSLSQAEGVVYEILVCSYFENVLNDKDRYIFIKEQEYTKSGRGQSVTKGPDLIIIDRQTLKMLVVEIKSSRVANKFRYFPADNDMCASGNDVIAETLGKLVGYNKVFNNATNKIKDITDCTVGCYKQYQDDIAKVKQIQVVCVAKDFGILLPFLFQTTLKERHPNLVYGLNDNKGLNHYKYCVIDLDVLEQVIAGYIGKESSQEPADIFEMLEDQHKLQAHYNSSEIAKSEQLSRVTAHLNALKKNYDKCNKDLVMRLVTRTTEQNLTT